MDKLLLNDYDWSTINVGNKTAHYGDCLADMLLYTIDKYYPRHCIKVSYVCRKLKIFGDIVERNNLQRCDLRIFRQDHVHGLKDTCYDTLKRLIRVSSHKDS